MHKREWRRQQYKQAHEQDSSAGFNILTTIKKPASHDYSESEKSEH